MKSVTLKPISEQVIVITGATSGIGLVTARMAAHRGAKLVLAARSEVPLRELVSELAQTGRQAAFVVADVSRQDEVKQIARTAFERFGGFDTWVNNAGGSAFAPLMELSIEDHRQIFETNYWGVVYGSMEAAEHLRQRGGAIINVGSVVSDATIPLQGAYSASKHAVKAFTEALRMELDKADAPVSVSLIKPTSIDTPFPRHAANYMEVEPTLPPPVYAPELVAEAILHCAEHPTRELIVGGGGKFMNFLSRHFPHLAESYFRATSFRQQRSDRAAGANLEEGLHQGAGSLEERGVTDRWAKPFSLYTKTAEHPLLTLGVVVAIGGIIAALLGYEEMHDRRRPMHRISRTAKSLRSHLGV